MADWLAENYPPEVLGQILELAQSALASRRTQTVSDNRPATADTTIPTDSGSGEFSREDYERRVLIDVLNSAGQDVSLYTVLSHSMREHLNVRSLGHSTVTGGNRVGSHGFYQDSFFQPINPGSYDRSWGENFMEQIFFSQKLDGLDRLDPGHVWFGYSFNTWQSSDEKLRRELGILSDDGRFCTTFCLAAKLDRSIAIELESAIKANPQFVREVVAGLVMRGFDCSFDDIDLGGVDGKMVRLPPYDKMPDHWPLTMFNMGVDQVSADLPSGGSFLRVTRGGVMESRVDPMTVMTRHKVDKYRPFKYVRELPPRVRANDRI